MQIDRQQIIDLLKSRGEHAQAGQAQLGLPDQVDTDQHADQLSQLGVNPADFLLAGLKDKFGL